jgi:hypothetical protein
MPKVMDERTGSVMAVSDQYAVAKIGNHAFIYGFTPSFQKEVPLLPVFQLAWIRPDGEMSPPIRRETVVPPEGNRLLWLGLVVILLMALAGGWVWTHSRKSIPTSCP